MINAQLGIDALDFVTSLEGGWDLFLFDPPYFEAGYPPHEKRFNNGGRISSLVKIREPKTVLGNWDRIHKIYEAIRSKMNGGAIVYFDSREKAYPHLPYKFVWYKHGTNLTGSFQAKNHEFIWVEPLREYRQQRLPYVLDYCQQVGDRTRPGTKPKALLKTLMERLEATHVIDPFAGYGNSIRAAMELGISIDACDLDTSLDWSFTDQKRLEEFF